MQQGTNGVKKVVAASSSVVGGWHRQRAKKRSIYKEKGLNFIGLDSDARYCTSSPTRFALSLWPHSFLRFFLFAWQKWITGAIHIISIMERRRFMYSFCALWPWIINTNHLPWLLLCAPVPWEREGGCVYFVPCEPGRARQLPMHYKMPGRQLIISFVRKMGHSIEWCIIISVAAAAIAAMRPMKWYDSNVYPARAGTITQMKCRYFQLSASDINY